MMLSKVLIKPLALVGFLLSISCSQPVWAQLDDDEVIDAVVNIHLNKVRAWDDGYNNAAKGTGFVIDSQKGVILTNKHILGTGPAIAYAEFSNKKIVSLVPIYRDPVHDFGLYQYNPEELGGLDISAIELHPHAKIGGAIRLYGNDGGEDLSIIEGVLSRTDRPAPDYRSTNTDFNTFYFQAALGSSGGSSGSPILDEKNRAIAINAGARRDTETAFFLPMEMIIPTVNKVLADQDIQRGTFQTVFNYMPFNRMDTLGLSEQQLGSMRQESPDATGKLVVKHVIPKGPGDGVFEAGDVLLSVSDTRVDNFFDLESLLNAQMGKQVKVAFYRNDKMIEHDVNIDDLFALTPNEYIEYGKAMAIPVGINMARLFNIPVNGVTLVDPGPAFGSRGIKRFALIEEVNNIPVNTLADFASQLRNIGLGEKFSVRYRYPYDLNYQQYKQLTDYSDWFDNKHCKSVLRQRHWDCSAVTKTNQSKQNNQYNIKQKVSSPIVDIEVFRPVLVNNLNDVIRQGQGAVIDFDAGLILTDKSVIDSSMAVIKTVFNNGMKTTGKVIAIHPYLNLALIKTDLKTLNFKTDALPRLVDSKIEKTATFNFLSKSAFLDFEVETAAGWPILQSFETFHDSYTFSLAPGFFGIYVNAENQIVAANTNYIYKKNRGSDVIPASLILDFVEAVKNEQKGLYKIESTFDYIRFADALELGLPQTKVQNASRLINVRNVEALGNGGLMPGDIVLDANGIPVRSLNQLYQGIDTQTFELSVLRNGKIQRINSEAKLKEFATFDNVLFWGGAVIHKMNDNVNFPEGPSTGCIRIGIYFFGSPMHSSKTAGKRCVYQVDGVRVKTVEALTALIRDKQAGDHTRVKVVELNNNFRIAEFRLREDPYYWPVKHWQLNESGWNRVH